MGVGAGGELYARPAGRSMAPWPSPTARSSRDHLPAPSMVCPCLLWLERQYGETNRRADGAGKRGINGDAVHLGGEGEGAG